MRSLTRPASLRTLRCVDTAGSVNSKLLAISVGVFSPSFSRSSICLRLSSAIAFQELPIAL